MNMDIFSDEWLSAVADLTEAERAIYDDPQTYADTMDADGARL
jgi:hypothetical protein